MIQILRKKLNELNAELAGVDEGSQEFHRLRELKLKLENKILRYENARIYRETGTPGNTEGPKSKGKTK